MLEILLTFESIVESSRATAATRVATSPDEPPVNAATLAGIKSNTKVTAIFLRKSIIIAINQAQIPLSIRDVASALIMQSNGRPCGISNDSLTLRQNLP